LSQNEGALPQAAAPLRQKPEIVPQDIETVREDKLAGWRGQLTG
jgi:hypothetical protein